MAEEVGEPTVDGRNTNVSKAIVPVSTKSDRLQWNSARKCGPIAPLVAALRLSPTLRPAVAAANGRQLVRYSPR
jgi:hypothetical protein